MVAKKFYKAAFKFLMLLVMLANMPLPLFAEYVWDYSGGILYDKSWNYTQKAYNLCVIGILDTELRNLDIPSKKRISSWDEYTVTSIEEIDCRAEGEIFYPWYLQSIRIPKTITSIGKRAFRSYHARQSTLEQYAGSVSELAEIIVDPENPNYTDVDGVLYNKDKSVLLACPPAKTECDIPATVTQIADYAFSGCWKLKSLTIPNSVTQIGYRAFEGCTDLETVTFPRSSISIGEYAFEDCKSLVSLNISGLDTSIDRYAFKGCDSLVSIDISGSSIFIDMYAFEDCKSLVSLNISGTETSIRACAFMNCESLVSIDISGSSIYIGSYTFENCKSLVSVNLSGTETSIGNHAFKDCESLVTLDFPDPLTSIGGFAFLNCKSLTSVSFPASLSLIGKGIFCNCGQLKEIRVDPGNENFADVDGVLYNKDLSELLICPRTVADFEIPSSVTKIGSYAFNHCTSLSEITLPAAIEFIGDCAFYNCTSLLTINSMRMRPPETGSDAFSDVPIEAYVYVPRKTVPYYLLSKEWSRFYYYFEVEEWVAGIADITADSGNAPQDIYTPQGVCIRRNATDADVKALPEGIYIIGGKKVYVK